MNWKFQAPVSLHISPVVTLPIQDIHDVPMSNTSFVPSLLAQCQIFFFSTEDKKGCARLESSGNRFPTQVIVHSQGCFSALSLSLASKAVLIIH